ncbi:DUF4188 domain-containing protein [Nocardioides panacis]|uniref:DUF4188 domain-containing protein n=1 Tax=Nocardioides panacis TaxID=2849501 RepID=A0A975T2A7_9ACTN|nr:DUF4188 domain-containing protein [Nocardioides panacis]QWZ10241.1 DUF4188 domain-containing protein [Nocardioides panacis]
MSEVKAGRWMADIDGDFVVFLIGARPDKRRLIRSLRDLGGRRGMLHMLQHLSAHPEKGLLGYEMSMFGGIIVQYWRSFEHLERFANDVADPHVAAWRNYWRRVGSDTRTGIWHETYLVRAGEYEAIYGNMPPFGLGKASSLVTMAEGLSARGRLKRRTTG